MDAPAPNNHANAQWSAPKERVTIQLAYLFIVLMIVIAVAVLAIYRDLNAASVTALYGAITGHLGTTAAQKLTTRSSDHNSNG